MIQQPHKPGDLLNNRYQIAEAVGQGGMSTVYKATDVNLQRVVAVKVIHPHLSNDPDFVRRFEVEAKTAAQLRHPNIVQVYDYNHDGPIYYIVLEFVVGESLQGRLQRLHEAKRTLELPEAIKLAADIGDALAYAHDKGLIHRDVKPANVMVNVQGEAILTDFGIVKIVGGTQHTATGAVLGTARYMSPEQIKGSRVDDRSDIYSFGVMLFEMVGGRLPFQSESVMTMMMMHVNDPVPDLHQIRPDVPPDVVTVINKALAKKPGDRYQTMSEMVTALRQANLKGEHTGKTTIVDDSPVSVLEPLYERLQTAVATSDWVETLALGGQIQAADANYRDVPQLMALARSKLRAPQLKPPQLTEVLDPSLTAVPRKPISKSVWLGVSAVAILLVLGVIFGPSLFSASPPSEVKRVVTATPSLTTEVVAAVLPTNTKSPTANPTNTLLPLPTRPPTETPIPRPTATPRPQPTATPLLPGRQTIPLAQLTPEIPWLAYDAASVPSTGYLGFNETKPPFDDVRVRQAFALAVDREAVASLMEQIGSGQDFRPAAVFTPPDVLGRDLYGDVGLPFDPDRAQALLSEAGYPNGSGLPRIELGFNENDTNRQMAELIAAMWQRNLGVNVVLQPYDNWNTYQELLDTDAPQIFRMGWAADFNDPDNFLAGFTDESSSGGRTNFNNNEFNLLVKEAANLVRDPAARQRLYIQAEEILVEQEAVIIPLYHYHVNSE